MYLHRKISIQHVIVFLFHCKYSANTLYLSIIPAEMHKVCHHSDFNELLSVLKACVSIGEICCEYIVFCRWWSMNDKSVHGFWEMWSLNAFCVKAVNNDWVWQRLLVLQYRPILVSNWKKL